MPSNKKVSELTELSESPSNDDVLIINDISDDTGASSGTTKKITVSNLLSGISSSGGGGIFVTNVTCGDNSDKDNGITALTKDTDETAVNNTLPILSAVVDTPTIRVYVQWEGDSNNWTGTPYINSTAISSNTISSIGGGYSRRFEGYLDIDLTDQRGETVTITYAYGELSSSIDIDVAGLGPEVTSFSVTSSPSHSQDHYKDGDNVTVNITFDTADISSISFTGGDDYATNTISNSTSFTLNGQTATITIPVSTTVTTKTAKPFKISAKNALGTEGSTHTSSATIDVLSGPVIISGSVGLYPTTDEVQQTELKNGDSIPITLTFDTTNVNQVSFFGGANHASGTQTVNNVTVSNDKRTTVNMTVIGTTASNNASGVDLPFRAASKHTNTHSQLGPNFNSGSVTVKVNNQKPTFSSPSISYPTNQSALKNSESANVNITVSNQGSNPSYVYSSPNSELNITDVTTYNVTKTVSRSSGTYNVNVNNFTLTVKRRENGTEDSKSAVVFIAHTAPTLSISSNNGNRMKSGGNDNTSQQNYNVVISTGNQRLLEAPTLAAPHGTLGSFSYTASSVTFTASMGVHDNDTKGTHTYTSISAKNLAGITVTNISSGSTYIFGGFVSRTKTLSAQTNEVSINVLHSDYTKVTIAWSANSSVTTRKPIDTTTQTTNAWCLASTSSTPVTVRILDFSKTNSTTVDSTITIQESQ